MKQLSAIFAVLVAIGIVATSSLVAGAEETAGAQATVTAPAAPTRGIRMTASYLNTFLNPFPPLSTSSVGPTVTYEFIVSKNVDVGMYLAYRPFLGAGWSWLGYGVVVKDYLYDVIRGWTSGGSHEAGRVRPYFEYGLLVASVRVPGREHYAIGHDTKLGIGLEVALDSRKHWHALADAAYHLTWLRYFNTDSTNLMAGELNLGIRYVW